MPPDPVHEQQRLAMSKALANTLESKTMTPEIRYWLLLQIQRTGKAEVLDVLAKSLGSADKIEQGYARAALEKNPDPQATEILLKALAATHDDTFAAGVISSLGNRQDPKAVEAVGWHVDHANPLVANTAVAALVKINTPEAVAILKQKLSPTHPAAGAIAKGLVEIAAVSPAAQANAIYSDLYAWSTQVQPASNAYTIRKAALMGLAKNDAADIDKIILADFNAKEPAIQSMAIAAAGVTKSASPAKAMAAGSGRLDDALQNQLIAMLADRQEPSAITPINRVFKSKDQELLLTAVDALSQLNTRDAAALLIELTRNDDIQVKKYSHQKAVESNNDSMDDLLRAAADSGQDNERAAAIVLLGDRRAPNITEQLLRYAQSDKQMISNAALEAIGTSAPANTIPVLCGMIEKSTNDSFKKSALSAINTILTTSPDKPHAYAIILKEIKSAEGDLKVDLIGTLKMSGDADAMNYCLSLITNDSFKQPVPQAALKALSAWSNSAPAKHFLDRANNSQHKQEYAKATLDLAKNLARYDKEAAKKIAKDVKALNISEAMNQYAEKIINLR